MNMSQFLGFGNGHDGTIPTSGVLNTYAGMSASAGSTTVTTSLSVAVGDMVLLHQSQLTNVGNWELVTVKTVGSGSFTSDQELINSYSTAAQAVLVPQYAGGVLSGSVTPNAWNGSTGGIIALCSSGKLTVSGTVTASTFGYRATGSSFSSATRGVTGEGTAGIGGVSTNSANGNGGGGGGGNLDSGHVEAGHGGGGGNGTAGTTPTVRNISPGGTGGSTSGSADLSTMIFGGAGGEGGNGFSSGNGVSGGAGGGIVFIFANALEVTGSIQSNGQNGGNSGDRGGAGGGGAGGSILIKTQSAVLGSNLVTTTAGSGGVCTGAFGGSGGNGGVGRIRLEACSLSGTTNPSASEVVGGNPWCYIMPSAVI